MRRPVTPSQSWLTVLALLPAIAFVPASAAETGESNDARMLSGLGEWTRPVFTINEFFDTTLPGTLEPLDLALDFRPRFGDFLNRQYIRFPFELRYGWTEDFEIFGQWTPVTPNPFRSGPDRRWGPGEAGLGFRYNLDSRVRHIPFATFSLLGRTPLGRPPVALIDGYAHLEPRLALMRPFYADERIFFILNLVYNRALDPPGHSSPPDEVVRRHISEIIPGIIFQPRELGYVLQYTFRHIDEPHQDRLAHAYRAGIIWQVRREQSERWNIPGSWQIEASYELTDEEQRSLNHAVILRARVRLDLRRHTAAPETE